VLADPRAGHLLAPSVRVHRLSVHPDGMAPHVLNLAGGRRTCPAGCAGPGKPTHASHESYGALIGLAAGLGLATYGASKGPELGWLSAGSAPAWAWRCSTASARA
jgi:hypothetical protein